MKIRLWLLLLSVFTVCSFFQASAQWVDPMNLPKMTQFVEDFSNVLKPEELATLRKIWEDFEKSTTNQVTVVLFPNRNSQELIDIWVKYFNENGIGQKWKDNGVLLLIATEEKKIRIITGYGMEWKIPDILASDIIEKDIRPKVNAGDFYSAVNAYYERVWQSIDNPIIAKTLTQTNTSKTTLPQENPPIGIFMLGFFHLIFLLIIWKNIMVFRMAKLPNNIFVKAASIVWVIIQTGFFMIFYLVTLAGFAGMTTGLVAWISFFLLTSSFWLPANSVHGFFLTHPWVHNFFNGLWRGSGWWGWGGWGGFSGGGGSSGWGGAGD